ncbi:MAG TPA: glutathione S-transferase family protein [Alphaproteobacteria bacterium]|nr:glutathione S-transferase family protein [Alphaproteobacteria bacterium]
MEQEEGSLGAMAEDSLDQPILHQYDLSPFSEKIRLIFGLKDIAWRAVNIPMILPKPDYVALTGGYRRTPALQMGAEIFCDTMLIADEIERRWPQPSLYPDGRAGHHKALAFWAETNVFWPAAWAAVGANPDALPADFHADRAAMRGRPPPEPEQIVATGQRGIEQLRPQLDWIARMLDGGNKYLLGDAPGIADLALYHCLWFLDALPNKLQGMLVEAPAVHRWMEAIAGTGHGRRAEMSAHAAIDVAAGANTAPPDGAVADPNFVAGQAVTVQPVDRASPPVTGGLALLTHGQVAVRRRDPRAGEVVVHFPRLGYRVSRV